MKYKKVKKKTVSDAQILEMEKLAKNPVIGFPS